MAQAVSCRFSPFGLGSTPRPVHVAFVAEKVALDRLFSRQYHSTIAACLFIPLTVYNVSNWYYW